MNETWLQGLSLVAGVGLGVIFFGGLWWTVQKGLTAARPAVWFLVSFLLRGAVVLGGFYGIAREHPVRLVFCVGGFLLARAGVTWLTRRGESGVSSPGKEVRHVT